MNIRRPIVHTMYANSSPAVTGFKLLGLYSVHMKKIRLLCAIDYGLATHWLLRLSSSHTYADEAEHFILCLVAFK